MIPLGAPDFYAPLPSYLRTVLDSGIAVTGIVAFLLHLLFSHTGAARHRKESAR
ncbi:hypothetical protein QWJ26_26205 [Streptomyces sp. CSDS2]|nr:hypothetical protein [Streptomyces sp. CSDS2]MDN3263246.1 hypothetical protein [Streptomyces sp. CSDS2]